MTDLSTDHVQNIPWHIDKKKSLYPNIFDLFAFIIPASCFIEFEAIGRIFGSDIICFALFPVLLLNNSNILKSSHARVFIALGILYLFGQIVSDLVQHSDFYDYSRGWAKIFVTIVSFSTILMLIGAQRSRILIFSWGIAVGLIMQFLFNPSSYAEWEPWKFGMGVPITWTIILLTTLFNNLTNLKLNIKFSLVFAAGAINLYLGFRSMSGICFLTLSYLILQKLLSSKADFVRKNQKKRIVLLGIGLATASILIIQIYSYTAQNGWLGEAQTEKYEAQARGIWGLIIGGRSEIIVSTQAIMESPLLGHGSWAKDWEYAEMLVYLKRQFGYGSSPVNDSGLIPTHSHFFGAWVEAGLVGAFFWGWVMSLAIRACIRLLHTKDPHSSLLSFIIFLLIWDILFSPFGATRRFLMPFYTIVMIDILKRYSRKSANSSHAYLYRYNII